jgi:predicted porin
MKKELLIASALVSTMAVAGVAQAATSSMSGHTKVGVSGKSITGSPDSKTRASQSSFSVSISETTDSGIKISTGFDLAEESGDDSSGTVDASGLTLTFTDGSKLDLVAAGNASGSHDISVPGSAGEESAGTVSTANAATTDLDAFTTATDIGFEYHTAADFMADGLKASFSYSTDTGAASTVTAVAQSHYAVGATYVTSAGDTAVTMGAGYSTTDFANTGTALSNDESGYHVGISAVTGNLTVAAGFADGDRVIPGNPTGMQSTNEVSKAGVKYVSGDITFNVGIAIGDASDGATGAAYAGNDSVESTSASVSYAVASGVTAILGYTNKDASNEGFADAAVGSGWYVGATVSF